MVQVRPTQAVTINFLESPLRSWGMFSDPAYLLLLRLNLKKSPQLAQGGFKNSVKCFGCRLDLNESPAAQGGFKNSVKCFGVGWT